ncbi:hypothetical protein HDK64DRAFT_79948 [Phyllosticta capitalensis]
MTTPTTQRTMFTVSVVLVALVQRVPPSPSSLLRMPSRPVISCKCSVRASSRLTLVFPRWPATVVAAAVVAVGAVVDVEATAVVVATVTPVATHSLLVAAGGKHPWMIKSMAIPSSAPATDGYCK